VASVVRLASQQRVGSLVLSHGNILVLCEKAIKPCALRKSDQKIVDRSFAGRVFLGSDRGQPKKSARMLCCPRSLFDVGYRFTVWNGWIVELRQKLAYRFQ
jgi:hypothetical protein